MATRIPHLLEPYLALPTQSSLVLLTNVLGATSNWLVLRYLYSCLGKTCGAGQSSGQGLNVAEDEAAQDTGVVFLSFMRDYAFWKEGGARFGLDLDGATKAGRFVFLDGLTGLHELGRHGKVAAVSKAPGPVAFRSPSIDQVQRELESAIDAVAASRSKTILVIDQLDLLLAASGNQVTAAAAGSLLLDMRERVHASVLTLAADEPLISAQITTLEREQAALVLSSAHEADLIISLRMLDTGAANDVSGVMRITRGGSVSQNELEEHEYLYFVGGDGGVRVFERGT